MKGSGSRFDFGRNWQRFLTRLNGRRIGLAERSLQENLHRTTLSGKTFVDVGSGSGLFSVAARRLGARVHSFDYDPGSVACTAELKQRYALHDDAWSVARGSILDAAYVSSLGQFDIVYSWGVLHHTGDLWAALEHTISLVAPTGMLYIALYNDQGRRSRGWLRTKRMYNRLPKPLRILVIIPSLIRLWGLTFMRDALHGHPLLTWRSYADDSLRGMDAWTDVVDWVGGYPFEVAAPEKVVDFCVARGFRLIKIRTTCGHGCNEFVFERRTI
jgi:2-polyprenyl-6-hydroxyphenyl methylase/3-demethylubiquinone-9 3-methyltransferase